MVEEPVDQEKKIDENRYKCNGKRERTKENTKQRKQKCEQSEILDSPTR